MFILNTTFHVENPLTEEFLTWIREVYIPEALASGLLKNPSLSLILIQVDPSATSYAMQFTADTIEQASQWHDEQGAALRAQLTRRWPERIVFFTTYMQSLPL